MMRITKVANAKFAAQNASPIQIEQLRELIGQFEASRDDLTRLARINHLFHQTISEASHNRYLLQSFNEFQDITAMLPFTNYAVNERFQSAHAEHIMIADAIEAHNTQEAESAARTHLHNALSQRIKIVFGAQCNDGFPLNGNQEL